MMDALASDSHIALEQFRIDSGSDFVWEALSARPTGPTSGSSPIAPRRGSAESAASRGDERRRSAPTQRDAVRVPLRAPRSARRLGRRGREQGESAGAPGGRVGRRPHTGAAARAAPPAGHDARATRQGEGAARTRCRVRPGGCRPRLARGDRASGSERPQHHVPRALALGRRLRSKAGCGAEALVRARCLDPPSGPGLRSSALDLPGHPRARRRRVRLDQPAFTHEVDRRRPAELRRGLPGCGRTARPGGDRRRDRSRPGAVPIRPVRREGDVVGQGGRSRLPSPAEIGARGRSIG